MAKNVNLAFRWISQFPEVVTILSGMMSTAQLSQNIETFSGIPPLSDEEKAEIEQMKNDLLAAGTIPCTACRYCEVCPKEIDIPTAIAAYNEYRSGAKLDNGRSAKTVFLLRYNYITPPRAPAQCVKCGKCREACPQHIDIPAVLEEIVNERKKLREK